MTTHNKSLLILVVAQIVCLAFGLWVGDRLLVSSAKWEVEHTGANPQEPAATNQVSTDALLAWLPSVRAISLLWIGALQATVAWLILSRLHGQYAFSRSQAQSVALKRERDLMKTRDAVIFGLAKLSESRDADTGHHLERISLYSTCLAKALRRDPRYQNRISQGFVEWIGISSALHDIGKVALEDAILNKTGELTADERFRMQLHAAVGGQCIQEIEQRLGASNFLSMAREIAQCHHERWDGTGYPAGLADEQIPLAARIVSIVDVYDALISPRVYKEALPHEECLAIICTESGKQFDPQITEVFLRNESKMHNIARCYASPPGPDSSPESSRQDAGQIKRTQTMPAVKPELLDELDKLLSELSGSSQALPRRDLEPQQSA